MIEKLFELIAPDECLVCGQEGSCLCQECASSQLIMKKPACVLCNTLNATGKVCARCRVKTKIAGASISYRYDGAARELISKMKYENKRSVARYFAMHLPTVDLGNKTVVSFVPCDGKSRRARGYDQAEILAKSYAKAHNLPLRTLLVRAQHKKQVGQKRSERFVNIVGNFQLRSNNLRGMCIILVDDVVTTGATISECAKTLRLAGAKKVWAVAVAKK